MRGHRALGRLITVSGAALVASFSLVVPAEAADLVVPSCAGFNVGITFVNSHGNPEAAGPRNVVQAGSQSVILTSESSEPGIRVQIAGAVTDAVLDPADGSTTYTVTGRSAQFLFEGDRFDAYQDGPGTFVFAGRVTFRQAADGTTTILSTTGSFRDICAALAP